MTEPAVAPAGPAKPGDRRTTSNAATGTLSHRRRTISKRSANPKLPG
jgi:hypothetical protein